MEIKIIFSTRTPHRRTLKFNDALPDTHSIITQVFDEVSRMAGPLWERLHPPPDVIDALLAGQPVLSPVVVTDDEVYLVKPDGKIVYAYQKNKELLPGIPE